MAEQTTLVASDFSTDEYKQDNFGLDFTMDYDNAFFEKPEPHLMDYGSEPHLMDYESEPHLMDYGPELQLIDFELEPQSSSISPLQDDLINSTLTQDLPQQNEPLDLSLPSLVLKRNQKSRKGQKRVREDSDNEFKPPRKSHKKKKNLVLPKCPKKKNVDGRNSFRTFAVFPDFLKDPKVVMSLSAHVNYPEEFKNQVISNAEAKFNRVYTGQQKFGRSIVIRSIPQEPFKPNYEVMMLIFFTMITLTNDTTCSFPPLCPLLCFYTFCSRTMPSLPDTAKFRRFQSQCTVHTKPSSKVKADNPAL